MTRAADIIRKAMGDGEDGIPLIRVVLIAPGESTYRRLDEGKRIDGHVPDGIRLDPPTHRQGVGQLHAHVYGRKGNECVAVNFDGTASHGTKGRLHPDDAKALKAQGFKIRPDRMVEWYIVPDNNDFQILTELGLG